MVVLLLCSVCELYDVVNLSTQAAWMFSGNYSLHYKICLGLQCFDTVGWTAGRASSL